MEIISKHEIKITEAEIKELIKKAYDIGYDFELTVVKDSDVVLHQVDDGWIDVPEDWDEDYCPTLKRDTMIDIVYRNGKTDSGFTYDWTRAWVQENNQLDIVKYRAMK